jgi:hypothetical protein
MFSLTFFKIRLQFQHLHPVPFTRTQTVPDPATQIHTDPDPDLKPCRYVSVKSQKVQVRSRYWQ